MSQARPSSSRGRSLARHRGDRREDALVVDLRAQLGEQLVDVLPTMSPVALNVQRARLEPETFRLPVEKIRDGYYTDAYFNSRATCSRPRAGRRAS